MLPIDHYERTYRDVLHIGRMGQYAWIFMLSFLILGLITAPFSPQFYDNPWRAAVSLALGIGITAIYFAIALGAMRLSKLYAVFMTVFSACFIYVLFRLGRIHLDIDIFSAAPLIFFGLAVFFFIYSYFLVVSLIAVFRIIIASRAVRRLISDIPPDSSRSVDIFTRSLGIPTSLKNVGRYKAVVFVLFFFASVGYSFIALSCFALPLVPVLLGFEKSFQTDAEHFDAEVQDGEPGQDDAIGEWNNDEEGEFRAAPSPVTSLLYVLAAAGLAIPLASAARAAGRKLARTSIQDVQSLDSRPPILFLRAFGDDQVQLGKARQRLIAAPFTFGHRKGTLDVLLLEEGTDYGPVVALGNPKDPIPPYGAARGYFKDEDWQSAVDRLANDSQAIVICVDDTDGVWWEVDLIAKRGLAQKTLFLLHPRHKDTESNRALCSRLSNTLTLNLAEPGALAADAIYPIVGFYFDAGEIRIARSSSFSLVAYMLALRSFQRTKLKAS